MSTHEAPTQPSLPLSHTPSIMHVCTHPPQPLFSQTTMAISMRMVRAWSRGTAARASAAPCGFPTREGHHECDGGRKRAILTQFWDLQIVHWGFLLSQSALSLAAIQHGHSCSFSEMSQMQCPQGSHECSTGVKLKGTSTAAGDLVLRTRVFHFSQLGSEQPTPWSQVCSPNHWG